MPLDSLASRPRNTNSAPLGEKECTNAPAFWEQELREWTENDIDEEIVAPFADRHLISMTLITADDDGRAGPSEANPRPSPKQQTRRLVFLWNAGALEQTERLPARLIRPGFRT